VRTAAVVAAAGASSRFGRPKALLPYDDRHTFLHRIVRVCEAAGVDHVLVTHPEAPRVMPAFLSELSRVAAPWLMTSPNLHPDDGLTGSVRTALELLPRDVDALLVWPVDCPFGDASLVKALFGVLGTAVASVPNVDGARGHPVAFSRGTFELLAVAAQTGGPRGVLAAIDDEVVEVPYSDPRIAHDVDTVDDYRNLFGREP
jgi:CTP:molybdopterin cytidylyltransferase MocA